MTSRYFHHQLVDLHYYRFGSGPKAMLCFHGYGMHGRQFRVLESQLGESYTFYGFDLFFHNQTKLRHPSLAHIKDPIDIPAFLELMEAFCMHESIERFSVIAYSMGTHYASVLTTLMASRIDDVFMLAPSFLRVFFLLDLLAKNKTANLIFYRLFMSARVMKTALFIGKKLLLIADKDYQVLCKEMAEPSMRYAFYGNVTYSRHLDVRKDVFTKALNLHHVRCHFIFGERDRVYHAKIADQLMANLTHATKTILDEDHDMVNENLPAKIYQLLYDH
ncbi:MAG: alpha/beta hydrolase [Pedobacter sp.]|nr:alpha/beta hydrolase [Pedobacter sp.]MDQ8053517.1 alpha/beta hydrolase [Pedobacter sp.]